MSNSISSCVSVTWLSRLSRPRYETAPSTCVRARAEPVPRRATSDESDDANDFLISVSSDSDQIAPATSAFTFSSLLDLIRFRSWEMPPRSTMVCWIAGLARENSISAHAAQLATSAVFDSSRPTIGFTPPNLAVESWLSRLPRMS